MSAPQNRWYRSPVALRKESVDRNSQAGPAYPGTRLSLSARRAWIEILYVLYGIGYIAVALRKESVDRNSGNNQYICKAGEQSLSARRAWIEIDCRTNVFGCNWVALRKESVDRNT